LARFEYEDEETDDSDDSDDDDNVFPQFWDVFPHPLRTVRRTVEVFVEETEEESDDEEGVHARPIQVVDGTSLETSDCAVCLTKLLGDKDKRISVVACGHVFHTQCLAPVRDTRCPLCRWDTSFKRRRVN
jgi:hypothetical protein